MIVYVILVLLLLTILAWTFIPNKVLRVLIGTGLTILLTCSVTILTMTFKNHYGMHQITISETKPIYSATEGKMPMGVLIVSKVGKDDKKHKIMVYQDSVDSKSKAHFVPNQKKITESIKKESYYSSADVKEATITKETTRWKWKTDKYKLWLNVGQENELVKQVSKVQIPKDTWVALSPKQLEKMQTMLTQNMSSSSTNMSQMAGMTKEDQAKIMVKMVKEGLKNEQGEK